MEPLDRQLQWLIALRLVIVTSVVVPYFLLNNFLPTAVSEPPTVAASPAETTPPAQSVPPEDDFAAGPEPIAAGAVDEAPASAQPEAVEPEGTAVEEAAAEELAAEEPESAAIEAPGAEMREGSPLLNRGTTTVVIAERRTLGLSPKMIYTAAGVVYLLSLLYIGLLRLAPRRRKINAYIQFTGDLLLITLLVYFTGGITSPFSLFYLVIIAVAATLLRRPGGFAVATLAYVLYAATLMAIYYGKLPLPEAHQQREDPTFRLTYNLVVHFVGFYAVAILTSVLAHRVSRAERELEDKSERLADLQLLHRDVIQSITSGLATTDNIGQITSVNRAGEEILGHSEDDLLGRFATELVGEERWGELTAQALATTQAGPARDGEDETDAVSGAAVTDRAETLYERGDRQLYLGFTLSPLIDAHGEQRGWNMVFQDLTQWRALEEKVRINDRMAAVGELAAGIAHEIGNPLAAISGSAQMLARRVEGDEQQEKLLGIMVNESQRLDRTIKGFLRFARPRERSASDFDIAQLIGEHFELLQNSPEVAPGHTLQLQLDPVTFTIVADPDQVSQVFWNLARNALKAMPDGGELHVGGYGGPTTYRMTFRDTGEGMTESQRSNLFHPFQSFFDSGTGIGMAIVYRIVRDHGGDTHVESTPGQGTTITVELPVTAEHWTPRDRVPAQEVAG